MNFKQLAGFQKVVELGSFTKAASVLHTAQSALSRQVQQLEEEMGVPLLTRLDRGVVPTEAGLLLHERAAGLLEQTRQLKEAVNAQAGVPQGTLSFGFPPSLFDLVTLPLLKDYRARFNRVLLHVTEGISGELLEMVLTGRLDAAVVSRNEVLEGLEAVAVATEPMVLAGPAGQAAWLGTKVPISRLSGLPLILTPRPNALRTLVDAALARESLAADVAFEVNVSRITLGLAGAGTGWAVIPYSAVHVPVQRGELAAAPISGLMVSWVLVYPRARAMSLATQRLRQLLLERTGALIDTGQWPMARLDA